MSYREGSKEDFIAVNKSPVCYFAVMWHWCSDRNAWMIKKILHYGKHRNKQTAVQEGIQWAQKNGIEFVAS